MKKIHQKIKSEPVEEAKKFRPIKKSDHLSKKELSRAVAIAEDEDIDLNLIGFMRDDDESWTCFSQVLSNESYIHCSIFQLARVISFNCLQENGMLDALELKKIWEVRYRIFVVGTGSDEAIADRHMRTYYKSYLERYGEREADDRKLEKDTKI